MRNARGFTLVELLVALAVFALVSLVAVGALRMGIGAKEQTTAVSDDIVALERMRAVLRADLLQLTPRPVREAGMAGQVPAVLGGTAAASTLPPIEAGGTIHLALVREGWPNPGYAQKRPSLQRVIYWSGAGTLYRRTRPYLDAVEGTPFTDEPLLTGVVDVAFTFAGPQGWQGAFRATEAVPAPRAVRVDLVHPAFGPLSHRFLAGVDP